MHEKSTQHWPSITFWYFMRNDPSKAHFEIRMQLPTIHIHTPSSKIELTRSYEFGHYRSFWKINKNTFLSKLHTWAWNIKMIWDQNGWLEDIYSFLKSPRTPPKVQNWRSYALLKLDFFAKLPKVNYPQNFKFCQMGPFFFTWFEFALFPTFPSSSHVPISHFYYLIWFLFEFLHFKSNIII